MFSILHLDEHLAVIDKPAGIPVLPDGWDKSAPFLLHLLEQKFGRIWVVHRLDKTTSGVMVFARSAEAHRELNRQFERRETEKVYHAILSGLPDWDEKTTCFPLRSNVGHSHRTVVDDRDGKPAETKFIVLRRGAGYALVEARPLTGRTHQIRVHACALGFPLLGDRLYSGPLSDLITRPALHAYSLAFSHPATGERLSFTASHPADFETALNFL